MMFPSLRQRRFIAKLLLAMLLGTQSCLALNAGFLFSPPATAESSPADSATTSCHSAVNANADYSRNLCRLHCAIDAQTIDHDELPSLPPCLEGPPILTLQAFCAERRIPLGAWHNVFSTDPPIPIRFCSFLI